MTRSRRRQVEALVGEQITVSYSLGGMSVAVVSGNLSRLATGAWQVGELSPVAAGKACYAFFGPDARASVMFGTHILIDLGNHRETP